MTYSVKEIFYTLQGEGANCGRPAVFCRFSGCNLWSGLERDRATALCRFCDTDFVGVDGTGGGKFATAQALVDAVRHQWPSKATDVTPYVVCTGGEPGLQLDDDLVSAFHEAGFVVAVETNGTVELPSAIDWVTVSPKARAPLRIRKANEIKVVWPQEGINLEALEGSDFGLHYLQPLDNANVVNNTRQCLEACLRRPTWRLSLQTHKLLGIR
jgi:7-carboxy-7-deazaguanine synthase (Cx14CxxC type)